MKKFPVKLVKLLVIIPVLALGFLLWKYGVNYPFMDEWDTPGTALVQFNLGQLTPELLMRQHNESRKFFPRLLFIFLSRFTNWNPRYGMAISFLLSCITAGNIYYLSKLTFKSSQRNKLICLTLACILIFSPMQWENWLFGLQLITFIPIAVITSSLAIIFSPVPIAVKVLVSGIFATVATFSFANGIISWVVIFPALYLVARNNRRSLTFVIAAWLLLFTANVAVYFNDYHSIANHPSYADALAQPIKSLLYYLSFLGSPLGIHQLTLNQTVGVIICLIIALCCWYLLKINHRSQLIYRLFPWLCILGYTLISAALTTAGRVGFGVEQSLSSRYITFSTYGIVALIYILAILFKETQRSDHQNYHRLVKTAIELALVFIVFLYPLNFVRGVKAMQDSYSNRLYGKSCLTMVNVAPEPNCIMNLYPDFAGVTGRVNELDRLGLIQPSLVKSDRLQDISRENWQQVNYGSLDSLKTNEDNTLTASGWAVLPQYNARAHAVVLAYQTQDGIDHAFAIAKPELPREDVVNVTGNKQYQRSGWMITFDQNKIPLNAVAVSAWSFDSSLARAFRLNKSPSVSLKDNLENF